MFKLNLVKPFTFIFITLKRLPLEMNTQNLWLESKQYCKFICYLWSVACGCPMCSVIDNCHTRLSCCDKISPFYLKFRAYVLEPVYIYRTHYYMTRSIDLVYVSIIYIIHNSTHPLHTDKIWYQMMLKIYKINLSSKWSTFNGFEIFKKLKFFIKNEKLKLFCWFTSLDHKHFLMQK